MGAGRDTCPSQRMGALKLDAVLPPVLQPSRPGIWPRFGTAKPVDALSAAGRASPSASPRKMPASLASSDSSCANTGAALPTRRHSLAGNGCSAPGHVLSRLALGLSLHQSPLPCLPSPQASGCAAGRGLPPLAPAGAGAGRLGNNTRRAQQLQSFNLHSHPSSITWSSKGVKRVSFKLAAARPFSVDSIWTPPAALKGPSPLKCGQQQADPILWPAPLAQPPHPGHSAASPAGTQRLHAGRGLASRSTHPGDFLNND